jgi:hypothetical protein
MKKWSYELNRPFSKEEVQMAKTHIHTPLYIKEKQIKAILRFYLIPVRTAIIKNINNDKYWQSCGEKETLIHCWWEGKLVHPLWKTVWRPLKKLKIDLPYDTAIPLLELPQGM